MVNNKPARSHKQVKVRPLPQSTLALIRQSLQEKDWSKVLNAKTSNEKADMFHKEIMTMLDTLAPQKTRKISNDDKPWFSEPLKKLDRKRRREFQRNRRSERYLQLQKKYKTKCTEEKKKFFIKMVTQVKEANPSQWYSMLKRISNYDQEKYKELQITEICHLTDKEQAEAIANKFNSISSEYEEVKQEDIDLPTIPPGTIPIFSTWQIRAHMEKIKTNKATVPGDIPAKILKEHASLLCIPLTDIINTSLRTGCWPDNYKKEIITPVGKVFPVEFMDQLRPISNLPNCNKIQERVIADMVISDMKAKLDPSQYGNQKNKSIQHYLVRMMHRIVTSLDNSTKGEVTAVLATFIDWKSAYSHQCHKLGIESFIRNGVRPALIPLLISCLLYTSPSPRDS